MNSRNGSIKARIRSSVFICILLIGISSILLLFGIMNGILFDSDQKHNTVWVERTVEDFNGKVESLMSMASWLSQNNDILQRMDRKGSEIDTILNLLRNQDDTQTYMLGSDIGPYLNKIVVFNIADSRYYIASKVRYGTLEDVNRILTREEFQSFQQDGLLNVAIYPSISINKPYEPVIAAYARGDNQNTYIYIEMKARVLDDAFEGFLGDNLFIRSDDGWCYPEEVPERFKSSRYRKSEIDIDMTPLKAEYYTERSPLSIVSPFMLLILGIIVLAAAALSYVAAHLLMLRLTKPIEKLVEHIGYLQETEDYGLVNKEIEKGDDEIARIGESINSMSISISKLLERNEKLFEEKKDTEMRLLQMEVNPHFLYNTLESIHWMAVVQKSDGIAEMSRGLSNLLKNISKGTDDHIPLSEELKLLSDYERIQQVRYMGLFEVIDRIPEELKHYHIIKFTLQPIVENAIFHGIEPSGRDGKIILFGHRDERFLYIDIIDNGVGMDKDEMDEMFTSNSRTRGLTGVGVRNVDERLKLTFGEECGVAYSSQKNAYTHVRVKLLLEDGNEDL